MNSATPLTARPDTYSSRRLSVVIPDDDTAVEREEPDQKLALSLKQSWQKAADRFFDETHEYLGSYNKITKDGVLGTLKQQYGADSKEAKKRDELMGTVGLILNGVELVGAVTAQAAGLVFGPADMCFNALNILFSIPRAVQKNAETLQALFSEVAAYLNNFRIYDRIDRRGMLDVALLTSNNDILITLVDLVLLAWKAMNHTFKVISKLIFLKSDDVADCLAKFKGLIDRQNQLTTTMTLEAVLKNDSKLRQLRQSTKLIDDVGKDTNRIVRDLAADNAENKNMRIDRDRISKIDKALDLSESLVTLSLDQLSSVRATLREETVSLLKENQSYRDWHDDHAKITLLYISGSTSSGKTQLLGALAWQIENQRRLLHSQQLEDMKTKSSNDDRSIYLTYFSFATPGKGNESSKFNTPLHSALKTIAAQLARQSTRYAKFLKQKLDTPSDTPLAQLTIQDLWKMLKLADFEAPANSLLYIFLDDFDQQKDNLAELTELMRPSRSSDQKPEKLKLKLILTGSPKAKQKLGDIFFISIDITEINQSLITRFINIELQNRNIFQDDDDDSEDRRNQVLNIIPSTSSGSFAIAKQKVLLLQQAIEEDADFETVLDKLQSSTINTLADEGYTILRRLGDELSEQHREQLREILIWCIYSQTYEVTIPLLEASLYLQRDKKSLEPLKRKIERRFEDAIEIVEGYIWARSSVMEAIQSSTLNHSDDNDDDGRPNTLINVSIDAASGTALKKFAADLDRSISNGDFGFLPQTKKLENGQRLMFKQGTAEYTILSRLLRALNDDGIQRQTAPLIEYAAKWLPAHVSSFKAESESKPQAEEIFKAQMRTVGKGLINFLCDPESIAYTWDLCPFDSEAWLDEYNVSTMRAILEDPVLLEQLDPIERRWVRKYTKDSGTILFYTEVMKTVAKKWIIDFSYRDHAKECFQFIDKYLNLLTAHKSYEDEEIAPVRTESLGPDIEFDAANQPNTRTLLDNSISELEEKTTIKSEQQIFSNGQWISPEAGFSEDGQPTLQSDSDESTIRSARTVKFDISAGNVDENDVSGSKAAISSASKRMRAPLLGNFSESSEDVRLWHTSILQASCVRLDGSSELSQLDLNTCLGIQSGMLQWEHNGHALENAKRARLSTDGKWIQLILIDGENRESLQTIRLDERIGNVDGTLTFVDEVTTLENEANLESGEEETESENPEIEFPLSYLERVERAAKWALGALKREMDWFALIRIGDTLIDDEPDAAIQYLHRSCPPKEDVYREVTFALAYAAKDNYQATIESFENVQRIMKQENPNPSKMSRSEAKLELDYERDARVTDLFTCLTRTADYYNITGNVNKAIELMEEALTLRPWACGCRWRLIHFLCDTDQFKRAKELFWSWDEDEASALQSPSVFLGKLIKDGQFDSVLLPVERASRRTDFYIDIGGALEKAFTREDSSKHDANMSDLLYVHGLIFAVNRESEALELAKRSWTDAFKIGRDMGGYSVEWSAKLTCMCLFDQAKEEFESSTAPTREDINVMMDVFTNLISQYETPSQRSENVGWRVLGYIACLGRITGQLERSRDILRQGMADAINILSDDDLYNDENGILTLIEVLARYGDMEGVFTALSLLDRTALRARIQAAAEAKATISIRSAKRNKAEDKKEPQESDNEANPTASQQTAQEVSRSLTFTCDHCGMQSHTLETGDKVDANIWMCRYCPDLSFCSLCKEKLLTGILPRFLCNPKHEFVLLKHPEYELYEIEDDNVRIEWQWTTIEVDDNTGEHPGQKVKKEVRTGGRMVTLQEWLDILKKDWNITETKKIEGKVQQ